MTQVWMFTVFIIVLGLLNDVSEASLCSTRGRFPNENVPNCQGYTMCLQGAPGVYTQIDLNCPDNFIYSHIDNQCTNVTSYQCYPEYKCIKQGNFESNKNKDCTEYVACVKGLEQIVTARLLKCSEHTLFSPSEGTCVIDTVFQCRNNDVPDVTFDAKPSQGSVNSSTNNSVNLCFKYALLVYLIFNFAV